MRKAVNRDGADMVTATAPNPTLVQLPRPFVVKNSSSSFPQKVKEDTKRSIQFVLSKIELEVLQKLLDSQEPKSTFEKLFPLYERLSVAISSWLTITLSASQTKQITHASIDQIKTYVDRVDSNVFRKPFKEELKEGLILMGLILDQLPALHDGEQTADVLKTNAEISLGIGSYLLALHAVSYYLDSPRTEWKHNAELLSDWGLEYARRVYRAVGLLQLSLDQTVTVKQ